MSRLFGVAPVVLSGASVLLAVACGSTGEGDSAAVRNARYPEYAVARSHGEDEKPEVALHATWVGRRGDRI